MTLSARLATLVVRRPRLVLLVVAFISLGLTPLAIRLRLDTDLIGLFPRHSPEAEAFARYSRGFISEKLLVILVESNDPAALPPFLDKYAAELRKDTELDEVRYRLPLEAALYLRDHLLQLCGDAELALLAERSRPEALPDRARRLRSLVSAPGGSGLVPILTADPFELLQSLQARLQSGLPVDTQSGYFRTTDGKAALIFVRPKVNAFDITASRAIIERAAAAARALGAAVTDDGTFTHHSAIEVGFTGASAFSVAYRDWLHHDTTRATELSGLAVVVLFVLFFRAPIPIVALPLAFGLWWTGALAVLLFGRVNAVSLSFGTILIAIGIDLPIQLFNRLREEMQSKAPLDALEHTMADLIRPSIVATLGPCAVFLACALSNYRGLGELGVLAALGLFFTMIAMLTVFPSLLALLPARWWALGAVKERDLFARLLGAFSRWAGRRPRLVLLVMTLAAVAALPLALRAEFDRRLISIQPEAMPPMRVERELERNFGQRDLVYIVLVEDHDPDGALQKNDRWLPELEKLRHAGTITGFQSAAALIPSKKLQAERRARLDALHPRDVADQLEKALADVGWDTTPFRGFFDRLRAPGDFVDIAQLRGGPLDFLVRTHVQEDTEHGVRRLATFVYAKRERAPGAPDPEAALRAVATRLGDGSGIVTGSPILERALYEIVRRDTIVVTASSTAAVLILLALYYRKVRPWLAVVLPLVLAWVFFAAGLVVFGWPLNLFNLLAVPLVIGYGIDDHIFLVHRHAADYAKNRATTPGQTLERVGRAVAVTSLATIAGFLPLGFARFDGLRLLGLTGVLAVSLCLFSAAFVLPPLLAVLYPPQPSDETSADAPAKDQ